MKNLLTCFFLFYGVFLQAQDTHYWTNQYGARASLLGGAAIAGLDDNSAVYYNPANLAFIKENTVSLNTSVYKYTDLYWGNGAGQGLDLQSQRISLYQQMISGLLTKNAAIKSRIGFNIITRQHANTSITQRHEGSYELNPSQDGAERYLGNVQLDNNINETWACLGWGYRLNKHFSVGLTGIITYRAQRYAFFYTTRAARSDSVSTTSALNVATNAYDTHTNTFIIGGLLKAGFHARFGPWRFGLNVTSPSISIWSSSKIQRELSQTNLPGNNDRIQTGEQKFLPSQYKYPLSIGLGASYSYKTGGINIAAEYFAGLRPYKMIEARDESSTFSVLFNRPSVDFFTVYNAAKPVLNFAIGWEQNLHERLFMHIGLRSDFSYAQINNRDYVQKLRLQNIPMNLWHGTLGFSLRRKASLVSVGVQYSYGHQKEDLVQLVNFTEPVVKAPLYLEGERTKESFANYHSVTLLIGFTYFFALK
ncbi:MAG: hypothetical protein ACRBFS_26440 [Aureispira sp.]